MLKLGNFLSNKNASPPAPETTVREGPAPMTLDAIRAERETLQSQRATAEQGRAAALSAANRADVESYRGEIAAIDSRLETLGQMEAHALEQASAQAIVAERQWLEDTRKLLEPKLSRHGTGFLAVAGVLASTWGGEYSETWREWADWCRKNEAHRKQHGAAAPPLPLEYAMGLPEGALRAIKAAAELYERIEARRRQQQPNPERRRALHAAAVRARQDRELRSTVNNERSPWANAVIEEAQRKAKATERSRQDRRR
jgi:hypothetical protein